LDRFELDPYYYAGMLRITPKGIRGVGHCLTASALSFALWLVPAVGVAEEAGTQPTAPTSAEEGPAPDAAPAAAVDDGAQNAEADGSEVSTDEAAVRAFVEKRPELACRVREVLVARARVWVACGEAGYLVLLRGPEGLLLQDARRVEGEVSGFFVQEGRIWARIIEERAVVVGRERGLERTTSLPALGAKLEPEEESDRTPADAGASDTSGIVVGEVTKVDGLTVEINIGSAHGVSMGSRIAISDGLARGQRQQLRKAVIIGKVVDLDEEGARVRIGVNEHAEVGASARPTTEQLTGSRVAPDRATGLWELRGMVRPLLSLGAFGGGVIADLEAGYRTRHFHFGARLGPSGVAGADDSETVTTWATYLFGAYDSWVFSAGLGIGAQAVNITDELSDQGSGLTLVQLLRLGAVDGLHLTSRTHAVVFRSQTQFAGLEMQGQISVSSDAWLILRGGGNDSGYGYGEVAIRNLLTGNGGRDSVFLEVSVGGAAIIEEYCAEASGFSVECSSESVGGPLVGVGAEWRL
jgi:hypothetical protein